MKQILLASLLLLMASSWTQPVLAQAGTSNGSGSGFLNTDIMVGAGGTPGPADLNLGLWGAAYRSGYLVFPRAATSVTGSIINSSISQPLLMPLGHLLHNDRCHYGAYSHPYWY